MTPYISTRVISPKMIGAPPPLEGPRVTLDQASFRALASEVRVEVLKRLDERRMTVTDLANALQLSKPTLLEHLEKLQAAELVKRIDEGRKWIYYDLTGRGKKILHPERVTIVVSLCLSFFLAASGIVAIASGLTSGVLYGPGAGPSTTYQPQSAGFSSSIPPLLLVGFGLAAAGLWFIGVALFFKVRGDVRRAKVFATLQDL
jgi:DNA-binding transcriptional ArsR family regulator